MDMVKKALLFICLLMAISELALSQTIRKEFRVDIRVIHPNDIYSGEVFCVVESKGSRDTLFTSDQGLFFMDSLPELHVTVFVKSVGDSVFGVLTDIDGLSRDSFISLSNTPVQDEEFFVENDETISAEPLSTDSTLGLAMKPCLQVRVLAFQYFESHGELHRYTPLDGEIRHTQEIKDFLFRSPWSFYILED